MPTISGQLTADNTDLLQGTRLQVGGKGQTLIVELQSKDATPTNNFTASLTMPGNRNPWDAVLIPQGTLAAAGILDDRTKLMGTFIFTEGGHPVLSFDETGTTTATYRVTLV